MFSILETIWTNIVRWVADWAWEEIKLIVRILLPFLAMIIGFLIAHFVITPWLIGG